MRRWSYPIAALTGRTGDNVSLDTLRAQLAAFIESQRETPFVQSVRSEAALVDINATGRIFWGNAHLLFDDPAKVTRDATRHRRPPAAAVRRARRGADQGNN